MAFPSSFPFFNIIKTLKPTRRLPLGSHVLVAETKAIIPDYPRLPPNTWHDYPSGGPPFSNTSVKGTEDGNGRRRTDRDGRPDERTGRSGRTDGHRWRGGHRRTDGQRRTERMDGQRRMDGQGVLTVRSGMLHRNARWRSGGAFWRSCVAFYRSGLMPNINTYQYTSVHLSPY